MEATGWDICSAYPFMPLILLLRCSLCLFRSLNCFVVLGIILAWSLLILIPGINLLGTWFFASKSWPIQRKGSTQS